MVHTKPLRGFRDHLLVTNLMREYVQSSSRPPALATGRTTEFFLLELLQAEEVWNVCCILDPYKRRKGRFLPAAITTSYNFKVCVCVGGGVVEEIRR